MNRIIRTLCIATLLLAAVPVFAQNERNDHRRNEWREKMKAEKIGFLTSEIGLTPDEAKSFWPVYEMVEKAREEATRQFFEAFRALEGSIQEQKGDAVISEALNAYLAANENLNAIDRRYIGEYRRILSSEKIARLYFAEEKFRRNQINRLGANPPGNNRK
ncbi:MAG: hypothetical protein J6W83_05625 [Bacteroidales bacterium]|nr:hypothetical protein [Bacteroidales bacterium]